MDTGVACAVGDWTAFAANTRATVTYPYLTSHPSYALLLLLTAPIPAVMVAATTNHGDSTFYWRVTGIIGLIIIACMALARVLAWYVFRFGRNKLDAQLGGLPISQRRLGWEWWDEKRTIAALPVVTVADGRSAAGEYRRVEGTVASDPVYWAPRGTGRGDNNYSGAGVPVTLPNGGEALLLAESSPASGRCPQSVPDFKGAMDDVRSGRVHTQGEVIDQINAADPRLVHFLADRSSSEE